MKGQTWELDLDDMKVIVLTLTEPRENEHGLQMVRCLTLFSTHEDEIPLGDVDDWSARWFCFSRNGPGSGQRIE